MSTIIELLLKTAELDTKQLIKRDGMGDVLATPREVDFLIRAPDAEKAELVASFVNDNCYGTATAKSGPDGHTVQVLISMPITQPVICSVSALMACISKIFDVEYDGWGSVVMRRE